MLLAVKGTDGYPHALRGPQAADCFSQMMQQVALAFKSGKWKERIMCGLVTVTEWNLFVIKPICISSSQTFFRISECYRYLPRIPERTLSFPPESDLVSLKELIAFLMCFLESFGPDS